MAIDKKIILGVIVIIVIIAGVWYSMQPREEVIALNGAGSSFIYPLMSKWASEFHKANKNITINYQSIGSGGGIRAILDGTVDFAASDAPLNADEYSNATAKGTIIHLPITIGAVVIAYNIPDLEKRLILSGDVIADIYLGHITKWNDPRIQELNPDVTLPNEDIIVVKRSDGSGTTYVFTDYLSHVSDEWKNTIGKTKIFDFPGTIGDRGLSAKGNEGVTGVILQNPYSIGYIELTYAIQSELNFALLKNRAGNIVDANTTTIGAAAEGAYESLPESTASWENVTIVDQSTPNAYPISSFVYVLVYEEQKDSTKIEALKKWLTWITTDGQDYADPLHYVPLPESIRQKNLVAINNIHSTSEVQASSLDTLTTILVTLMIKPLSRYSLPIA